jgi:hypothetical protein
MSTFPDTCTVNKPGENPLAPLLMKVVGRAPTNFYVARREARVLADAMPHLNEAQRVEAQDRIATLQTKWGSLLTKAQAQGQFLSLEIEPVQLIAQWFRRRSQKTRIAPILMNAARAVKEGADTLVAIMERAYENDTERLAPQVSYSTFRQWMIELNIAEPEQYGAGKTRWIKGEWNDAWVEGSLMARALVLSENCKGQGSNL